MSILPSDPNPKLPPSDGAAAERGLFRLGWSWSHYRVSSFLFLRLLGLVYFIAFLSFLLQVDALIGSRGILPASDFFQRVHEQAGGAAYGRLPSLCWLAVGDGALHVYMILGLVFSVLLIAGLAPALATIVLWVLYLSATLAGQVFWGYQWDNLLLEAGFLAIWLAPWRLRSRLATDPAPPRLAVFLLHGLLFRLMLSSGVVKLASEDPAWSGLTALTYHYWTQPLPVWTAWYVHQLPLTFHKVCCGIMFAIELVLPFFIWGPRVLRYVAFAGFAGLMLLIAATGNYTFFNLLTLVLCVPLLDDRVFRNVRTLQPGSSAALRIHRAAVLLPAALIVLMSSIILTSTLQIPYRWPRWSAHVMRAVAPFRSINGYGLFAVMTKTRMEILVQGSADGVTWRDYEFKWKPGRLDHISGWVAPHQPRLDWQMWFASLGNYEGNPWFISFLVRIMHGEPAVLKLLAENPFPDAPPKYLRAEAYDYTFTTAEERAETGAYWKRTYRGLYCPVLERRDP